MATSRENVIRALRNWRDGHDMRESWHEPDEQGVSARVEGDHLDNAMGLMGKYAGACGELVVVIEDEQGESIRVNLATLLAIAADA